MPNVLGLVSFRIYPTLMGGQKGVALFYQYLSQHLNVWLAASSDNEASEEVQLEGILFPNKKIYFNVSRMKQLKQMVTGKNIDVIIAEHSYTGWMAWWLHRKTGKPFIIHSHNIESKRFRQMNKWWWKIYHRYEGWIHRKANHNFFISSDDMQFAIKEFRLDKNNCSVVTYGIEKTSFRENKHALKTRLGIDGDETILLFNGTLDYEPNYDAVVKLVDVLDPLLCEKMKNYKIVITGNRAPGSLLRKMSSSKSVRYAGYVNDVNDYYQCADLFLNPVVNDTGVKTKLIEAMANHCTSISTQSGANGLMKELCGDKLVIVADHDWNRFAQEIVKWHHADKTETPREFFEHYDWNNIVTKCSETIKEVSRQ